LWAQVGHIAVFRVWRPSRNDSPITAVLLRQLFEPKRTVDVRIRTITDTTDGHEKPVSRTIGQSLTERPSAITDDLVARSGGVARIAHGKPSSFQVATIGFNNKAGDWQVGISGLVPDQT
jgi:hypothetical protein